MKDISIYFSPVDIEFNAEDQTIGSTINSYKNDYFPEIKKGGIALFYVPEYRGDEATRKFQIISL
jgi:hypothetical protein